MKAEELLTENDIQRAIIKKLKARGALVFRMNAGRGRNNQRLAPAGTPDLFVLTPFNHLWIEVKTPKGKLSADQEFMHMTLRGYGEEVIVVHSAEEVS